MQFEFAFITIPLEMRCHLPAELVPGHVLRRATDNEIDRIREGIKPWDYVIPFRHRFEHKFVISSTNPNQGTTEPLDREQWRYYVIEAQDISTFEVRNGGFIAVEEASRLTDVELKCPMCFLKEGGVLAISEGTKLEYGHFFGQDPIFTDACAKSISSIHAQICAVRHQAAYADVARSFDMFGQLDLIERGHGLYVLGLFAVIESLLTHNPNGEYDSLGHQIRSKMALLSKRFEQPIDYSSISAEPADKIWSKLYNCRSRIAHGGELDFGRSLKPLKHAGQVGDFLRIVAKKLLRQALIEPQLILDLRAC